MSKKRTSTESSNDDRATEEVSDAVSRQQDNAKRGKFATVSDTTLQDIPTEMLQCILVKAISLEVRNMKLAKSVWKEKADLVIIRLGFVCSQWSSVLTTDFFRMELHRALDGIAQEKFRMVRVQDVKLDCSASGVAALKDDIFLFCFREVHDDETAETSSSVYNITVYDRNNMAEVKDVIEIPGLTDGVIVACNVSNCVYVLHENVESQNLSVLRITRDEDQKFDIKTWISDLSWSADSFSISDDGRIVLSATPDDDELAPHTICVYNPNGFLHHEVVLSRDVCGFEGINSCIKRKSNGNLLLASLTENQLQMQDSVDLAEIDTNGTIQRQYKSSLGPENGWIFMSFVDAFGRILIHDTKNEMELLDSELNLLEFTGPQSEDDDDVYFDDLHFDSERNEVMGVCAICSELTILRIFRVIEE